MIRAPKPFLNKIDGLLNGYLRLGVGLLGGRTGRPIFGRSGLPGRLISTSTSTCVRLR